MYKNERQDEIIKILSRDGYATVENLSNLLYTSPSSIRRDLIALEKQGLVRRSYGGVEPVKSNSRAVPFSMRVQRRIAEKKCMAQKAAQLVRDKDIVFLDQSSSALFLAQELADRKITIVTNNVEILSSIYSQNQITIYSSGGALSHDRGSLLGDDACAAFEKFHADFAFFSSKALSFDGVIYDASLSEVLVKEAMLRNASRKVFLCDSEKFDTFSGYKQRALSEVDVLISEDDSAQRFARMFPGLEVL